MYLEAIKQGEIRHSIVIKTVKLHCKNNVVFTKVLKYSSKSDLPTKMRTFEFEQKNKGNSMRKKLPFQIMVLRQIDIYIQKKRRE